MHLCMWGKIEMYDRYLIMCIGIGTLSTLFVLTPCLVKVDYIDNNRVMCGYSFVPV